MLWVHFYILVLCVMFQFVRLICMRVFVLYTFIGRSLLLSFIQKFRIGRRIYDCKDYRRSLSYHFSEYGIRLSQRKTTRADEYNR